MSSSIVSKPLGLVYLFAIGLVTLLGVAVTTPDATAASSSSSSKISSAGSGSSTSPVQPTVTPGKLPPPAGTINKKVFPDSGNPSN